MKEGHYKKPLALVLSLCLVLTMFSGVSFATEDSAESLKDSGTPVSPEYHPSLPGTAPLVDSAAHLVITKWEWVDDEQILTWDESRGAYILSIPTDPENPADKALILHYLPKEIKATLADGAEKVLEVVWDEEMLDSIDGKAWSGEYFIFALPAEGVFGEKVPRTFFLLILDSPAAMAITDPAEYEGHTVQGIDPANTVVNLFDYTVDPSLGSYDTWIPADQTPDRWTDVFPSDHTHSTKVATGEPERSSFGVASPNVVKKGINDNHLLLFGTMIAHAGLWNRGAGEASEYGKKYAGMEGIVRRNLYKNENDAEDQRNGYPTINLDLAKRTLENDERAADVEKIRFYDTVGECQGKDTYGTGPWQNLSDTILTQWNGSADIPTDREESLNYLFNPEVSHDGKDTYEDVKGLFQLDENGYYYYDMRKNYAYYHEQENKFVLFDAAATVRTDGKGSVGNFFPFTSPNLVFSPAPDANSPLQDGGKGAGTGLINHYLGMTVETTFRQPLNGKISAGTNASDMTFEFSGDDDVWVFVDDVLVLDIGGVHSELYGKINFATGEVLVGRSFYTDGIPSDDKIKADEADQPEGGCQPVIRTTLLDQFKAAGAEDETRWNGNTFASNTSHTLKMFFMERGNYDSSLALRFNLQPLLYQQIRKVDQNGQSLGGAEFGLYPARRVADGSDEFNRVEKMNAQERREAGYIECNNVRGATVEGMNAQQQRKAGYIGYNNIRGATADPPKLYHYFIKWEPKTSAALTTLKTSGEDGMANFEDVTIREGGDRDGTTPPFNFSDRYQGDLEDTDPDKGLYYVLHESTVPDGYRTPPLDIALEFDADVTMLTVANRWTSGAYASFVDNIQGTSAITYGHFDAGTIKPDQNFAVSSNVQHNGLIVAVPMLEDEDAHNWNTIYGNNIDGFSVIKTEEITADSWRHAVLKAALYQCAHSSVENSNYPAWIMGWNDEEGRLTGRLEGLPGVANRYHLNNADGDMQMVFGVIVPQGLEAVLGAGSNPADAEERYKALGQHILGLVQNGKTLEQAVSEVAEILLTVDSTTETTGSGKTFSFLNVDQFSRNFRSLIYIPNEQRELRVRKIDQNNQPVEGARFAIYRDEACTNMVSEVGETDEHGDLIFAPYVDNSSREKGRANMVWIVEGDMEDEYNNARFYLKELSAPPGYQLNRTVVPIEVGYYSIYADAGTPEDGVSVMAGVGKLNQTMVKYAQDQDINITLRDVTAFAQFQPSGGFDIHGWQDIYLDGTTDVNRAMNLHYKNGFEVVDYGLHAQDGGGVVEPFFTTDTGFLRARVRQNSREGQAPYLEGELSGRWEDLHDTDLTNIFSLLNIVVITDQKPEDSEKGSLRISKRIVGENLDTADHTRNFWFTITFTDADGVPFLVSDEFYFYGTDKEGTIHNGESMPLHHDEEIVIRGLPYGTRYTVTEARDSDFPYTSPGLTATGQITPEHPEVTLPFVNSKTPFAAFSIRKTVTGEAGDKTKEFHFTVTLRDKDGRELTGSYPYNGSKAGDVRSGGTITLRDGESVTITGLPIGASYAVVEQEADRDGYTTTATGAAGSDLTADTTPEASFVNHRDPGGGNNDDDDDDDDDDPPPTTTTTTRKTPDTGDITETDGWAALSLVFLAGIAGILYYRWRKKSKGE